MTRKSKKGRETSASPTSESVSTASHQQTRLSRSTTSRSSHDSRSSCNSRKSEASEETCLYCGKSRAYKRWEPKPSTSDRKDSQKRMGKVSKGDQRYAMKKKIPTKDKRPHNYNLRSTTVMKSKHSFNNNWKTTRSVLQNKLQSVPKRNMAVEPSISDVVIGYNEAEITRAYRKVSSTEGVSAKTRSLANKRKLKRGRIDRNAIRRRHSFDSDDDYQDLNEHTKSVTSDVEGFEDSGK